MYYIKVAEESIEYVERSLGLELVERKKLNFGPYDIESTMQIVDPEESNFVKDYIEHLDFRGEYGNAESLSIIGLQYLYGSNLFDKDYKLALECF